MWAHSLFCLLAVFVDYWCKLELYLAYFLLNFFYTVVYTLK